MIKKKISRTTFQAHLIDFVRDEMYEKAIKDDGIYSTFELHNKRFTTGETRITLYYYKFDGDCCSWMPKRKKILYKTCPELGDVRFPYISAETMKSVTDRIKLDMVKNDNAIWSTISFEPWTDHFTVSYEKAYVKDLNITSERLQKYTESDAKATEEALTNLHNKVYAEAGIKAAEGPMTAQGMEIENTKRTLRRIQENSYYGLYPRNSGTTYAFDEMSKQSLKKTLETWKAKADLDIHSPSKELLFNYYNRSHAKAKEEKEKKDMNVTLMVVPEGMNKDFVRKVKANYQSNNSLRLFIASTDIDYSCEHEPIKTKYDLFEKWIKTGYVDVVYFMLGFEKDPDVKAFESFVRGITEFSGKVDVRVAYQRDDILNDANNLRTAYFDEADAKEDLENAGNKVAKEAKTMLDIYGLDYEGLEAIRNSTGRIDASEKLVMGKIMDVAFASDDEDAKPAKKGGKK